MLPWSDAIQFGRFLFLDFPSLQWLVLPATPILIIEQTIPFGNLFLFLLLFIGITKNPNIPYFLRFNTLQVLLMDIAIIVIAYCFQIIFEPFSEVLLVKTLSSTFFLGSLATLIFSLTECIQGKEPNLPGISEAVRMQL